MNTRATLELECGAIPSSVRLNVSVGTAFCGSCATLLPDVVADAVQVKAKKIEMIIVASIVFFMLENLLFSPTDQNVGDMHLAYFQSFCRIFWKQCTSRKLRLQTKFSKGIQ